MPERLRVACIQNSAENNTENSLVECGELIAKASTLGAELICLPEYCSHLGVDDTGFQTGARKEDSHPAIERFVDLARKHQRWIQVGSVAVTEGDQFRNRSLLINAEGEIVARYDKIHLFDVSLGNGEEYRESDVIYPGDEAVVVNTPMARLGLSVCYDLRFAALYRTLAQAGAEILTVPAAFTHTTGKAHWHPLLRSRAIETGSFVVAACQYGYHGSSRSYGHSLIVGPWGEILAEGSEEQDVVIADLDLEAVQQARRRIPALQHDRQFSLRSL